MDASTEDSSTTRRHSLWMDRSFWGMFWTQFLGAFNDNLYKQMVLLLALPVATGAAGMDQAESDLQGWATFVFALPFVLFSGWTGYLSDRFSKTPIIVGSKIAEIVIMLLACVAFLAYGKLGMAGTWTVLFLMAMQSTFFGPGKYGILPELFDSKDLPRANGLMLMGTFLAVIFGVVFAGQLFDSLVTEVDGKRQIGKLWIGSLVCTGIAVLGTLTSLVVRRAPVAQPNLKWSWDSAWLSHSMRKLLLSDRGLLMALIASCVFWMVSAMAMPTINRLGTESLKLNKAQTGILVGMIAIGIMLGGPLGGWLCRRLSSRSIVTAGLWGIVTCLALLSLWKAGGAPLWSSAANHGILIALGITAAIYSIPIQVYMQDRPPMALKGRMVATMNQANFLGMLLAGPLYQLFESISHAMQWPIQSVFGMIGLLVLPLALFYRLDERPAPSQITGSIES
jgi:acyl-[acyl-carrier-protein]-phospholipid O-acyltransferase/long-chain-fatty-acid--[acyl-carrier-protein] ligase